MTGIEVVKLRYWILKWVGFVAFGIFNGFNLKEYERYFGSHTEDVLIVSFSSIMGILDATHGEKVEYLATANGALIKVSRNLKGHPQIPASGYFDVKNQVAFDGLFEFSETPLN